MHILMHLLMQQYPDSSQNVKPYFPLPFPERQGAKPAEITHIADDT